MNKLRTIAQRIPVLESIVFFTLLLSFAFFSHSTPGWNVNSRMNLSLALAETGHAHVDDYVTRPGLGTQDLAKFDGHLYSDKSIGTSLLGVPAVWTLNATESVIGRSIPTWQRTYLLTVMVVGLSGAAAGVLLMHWLSMIWFPATPSPGRSAAFATMGVTLGTMLLLYNTLFMSYGPATMFLVGALLMAEKAFVREATLGRPVVGLWIGAGLLAGLATLSEYIYGAAALFLGIYAIWRAGRRGMIAVSWKYGLGCLIGITPFLIYTLGVFGQLAIPYKFHLVPEFRTGMSMGFMGSTWPPNLSALWLTTFHPFRGLFVYSPLLLLGLVGLIGAVLRPGEPRRVMAGLCLISITLFLAFSSAYYMWWGGWSFSPRHLAPAIPFFAVGIGPWLRHRWGQAVCVAAGLYGIVVHTLVNATEPQTSDGAFVEMLLRPDLRKYEYLGVFKHETWPMVLAGAYDRNLGSAMGLEGGSTLIPLVLLWLVASAGIWWVTRPVEA